MTYDYACRACGAEWVEEHSIIKEPSEYCTECGKRAAYRCISQSAGTGFVLKGAGWSAAAKMHNRVD